MRPVTPARSSRLGGRRRNRLPSLPARGAARMCALPPNRTDATGRAGNTLRRPHAAHRTPGNATWATSSRYSHSACRLGGPRRGSPGRQPPDRRAADGPPRRRQGRPRPLLAGGAGQGGPSSSRCPAPGTRCGRPSSGGARDRTVVLVGGVPVAVMKEARPPPGHRPVVPDRADAQGRPVRVRVHRQPPGGTPAKVRLDPLGAKTYAEQSIAEMPGALKQPWSDLAKGVPEGKREALVVKSTALKSDRKVTVYTPAGYDPKAGENDLLIAFDGEASGGDVDGDNPIPGHVVLDNRLLAEKVRPLVAVFVESGETRGPRPRVPRALRRVRGRGTRPLGPGPVPGQPGPEAGDRRGLQPGGLGGVLRVQAPRRGRERDRPVRGVLVVPRGRRGRPGRSGRSGKSAGRPSG